MIELPGIKILLPIYESSNSLVYRGIRAANKQPIILKILKENYPTPAELIRYHQEYEITRNCQLDGVVKAYELQKYHHTLVMILEDFGGKSLDRFIDKNTFNLQEFIKIAIQITDILGTIHQLNVVHKDINPSNIVFNSQTSQLKIIDFGLSTILPREHPELQNPHELEGTLAYISPEQTGRMNRTIDYRTDFYSLGATFYEILTNQPPFADVVDAMELVHCHIAKQPLPPHIINPKVPIVVSQIIMKLMAKTAEARYQSAYGIKADLERCFHQLQNHSTIDDFCLGTEDICDKFYISQKLYGREREIQNLLAAFARVSQGKKELMLVSGYSGVGKSAIVQEIYQPITQQRGYFTSGKFDQLQRNIPYSAIIYACKKLILQLLTETEEQLQNWRNKFLDKLGVNAQVIIDVIPEVELVIGKQPEVTEVAAIEYQNRFNIAFQNFISVFAQKEHPLVIFLDDLHWADIATLKLIHFLLSDIDTQYLLVIGSYRDNEVDSSHPLIATVLEIQNLDIAVNSIKLSPLNLVQVNQLIADTLNLSQQKTESLGELVFEKTRGNPFFMGEFLTSLYVDRLINFDFQKRKWRWDLAEIRSRNITNNVVELMTSKIAKLPAATQQILKLAACIGNQFDLFTLSIVNKDSQEDTAHQLWLAIQDGLILPVGDDYKFLQTGSSLEELIITYKFVHDRVQQAAYSLITEEQKPIIHLQIGRLLLEKISQKQQEEHICDIVNQLNFGSNLLENQQQRDELAKLNLIAAKKAKASAAYQTSYVYLTQGLELLSANKWQNQYHLTLELYTEVTELAYLIGSFDEMEKFADIVLQYGNQLLDKVQVYEVKILAYIAQRKPLTAIDISTHLLNLLGIRIPKNPNLFNVLIYLIKTKLVLLGKRVEDLFYLPEITSAETKAAMNILYKVGAAAYIAHPNMFCIANFTLIKLSVKYGNTEISAIAYATYGLILCGVLQQVELGYQFGKLAVNLVQRLKVNYVKTTVTSIVSYIHHWRQPARDYLQTLKQAYIHGLDTGNLEYASYCAISYSVYCLSIGLNLIVSEQEIYQYSKAIKKFGQQRSFDHINVHRQVILNLLDKAEEPSNLIGESYDELKMLPLAVAAKDNSIIFDVFTSKLILCYLFGKYEQALKNGEVAAKYLQGGLGSPMFAIFHFYDSLNRLAAYHAVDKYQQKNLYRQVQANQRKLKKIAYHAPMNYLQRFYLVEAERYRVLRQDFKATEYYEKAIKQAKENEYIHEEALAYELTASFYLHKGQDKIAQAYMQEARYCYLHWGAIAKVKDLDNRYPQLLKIRFSEKQLPDFEGRISRPSSSSDDNISSVLDLASIMKVFQTLSQEIVLEKLLAKLMETVIKNAGAQTGILILDDYGHWVIQAAGELNSHPEVLQSISLDNCEILPISLINYVTRTKESVVLNNATRDNQFNSDIYIRKHQPQSVLCAPLIHQGKLTSIVYLENNLTTGAFTYERLEIVKLLCSQAAIYLENAKLYAEKEKYAQVLEQKVTERTQELEKANQELHRLAIVDGLTQIANRRRFNEYLIQQWQKLAKEKQPLCLILCDVDYFKLYNDFYGHQKGDDCLRQVAKAMADAIPHPQDLVARYGGEEFAVILPQCDVMDAFQLAEAVRTQVEKLKIPHVKSEVSNYISLSLGVGYMIPSLELSAEVLIAMADEALYAAKKQGRNQTMVKNIINKFIAEEK